MPNLYQLYRLQQAGAFKAPEGSALAQGINLVAARVPMSEVSGGSAGQNGQSSGQISRLDEFINEEGGLLPVFYGEHLVAGQLIVHKYTPGSPPQSIFVVAIGEGELADEGNLWYAGELLTNTFSKTIWVEDAIPTGATAVAAEDGWNWIATPFSGSLAHQSIVASGFHQHYFTGATATLSIATGDWLYTYIFIDPFNPVREIMLQWNTSTFDHRAYWGENLIAFGTDGTDSRRYMGPLPPAGQWVRLAVPASLVGLEGSAVNGMAFTLYDGRATWDQAGKFAYGTGAGYHFHPGTISQGIYDSNQPVDPYLSSGLAYSGTGIVVVKLTTAQASEDRPDKFRGRFRGRKVRDYDARGNLIGYYWNTGSGLIVADRIREYFHKRYYFNQVLAEQKFWKRINWPAWRAWNDYSDNTLIPWHDGTSLRNIVRFECHASFLQDANLADVIDTICASVGAFWQDDGEQLTFLSPADRDPIHHFDESNIVKDTLRIAPRDLRETPNYFIARFRDLDDPFFGEVTVEVRRDKLIDKVGEIRVERAFPPMRQSQAMRLLERMARIEADNRIIYALRGDAGAFNVLPGDFVTLSHPLAKATYQKCLVLEINALSGEDSPDEIEFTLLKVDGPLYSDTAHGPKQEALAP